MEQEKKACYLYNLICMCLGLYKNHESFFKKKKETIQLVFKTSIFYLFIIIIFFLEY